MPRRTRRTPTGHEPGAFITITTCCGKHAYATPTVALTRLHHHLHILGRPLAHTYQCPRGWWHLTSNGTPPASSLATTRKAHR